MAHHAAQLRKAAREWAEEHLDAEDYERVFGEVSEDGDGEAVISVRVPARTRALLDRLAAQSGRPKGEIVSEALSMVDLGMLKAPDAREQAGNPWVRSRSATKSSLRSAYNKPSTCGFANRGKIGGKWPATKKAPLPHLREGCLACVVTLAWPVTCPSRYRRAPRHRPRRAR